MAELVEPLLWAAVGHWEAFLAEQGAVPVLLESGAKGGPWIVKTNEDPPSLFGRGNCALGFSAHEYFSMGGFGTKGTESP